MANAACATSLQMCGMRVTALDSTGAIRRDGGAGSATVGTGMTYISTEVIEVGFSFNIEDGDEFELKTACGDQCAYFQECDTLKNIGVDLSLCKLDPELLGLLTGNSIFLETGTSFGMEFLPGKMPSCETGVSLEFWSKAINGNERVADPYSYIRWFFPRVRMTLSSDFTLQNDFLTLSLTGDTMVNGNIGLGPVQDWPAVPAGHGGFFYDSSANYDALNFACGAQDTPIAV